jgi:hypothetical protein
MNRKQGRWRERGVCGEWGQGRGSGPSAGGKRPTRYAQYQGKAGGQACHPRCGHGLPAVASQPGKHGTIDSGKLIGHRNCAETT